MDWGEGSAAFPKIGTLSMIITAYFLWFSWRLIYRVYFHPLSKYPGSKLAAVSTEWYEWWWNIHKPGRLLFEIERLHKENGPVIRIGVDELHINSPEFFQEMTKVGSKFHKEPNFYRGISFPTSSIGLVDPSAHRIRRQTLNPLFTAGRIQMIAPRLQGKIEQLCARLDDLVGADKPINLYAAFKSVTMDIVSELIFGQSFGVIDSDGFRHPHLDALHDAVKKAWIFRAFPTLAWLSLNMPDWISSKLFPVPIKEFGKVCQGRIDNYLQERESSQKTSSDVLEQLLNPHAAPGHTVPSASGLNEEALTLLTAGNDTTSNALILGAYFILTHPEVHQRLVAELRLAFLEVKGAVTFEKAKELPYLTAVLKEVLRCSSPLPGRLPRIVPSEGAYLNGQWLNPGVIVHTSAYLLNRHESVWGADSNEFDPDRWTQEPLKAKDRYMTSFGKGSRQCLGFHLAWCELYLLMATLFRRYEIKIHDTTPKDMEWTDHLLMLFNGNDFHIKLTPRLA